MNTDNPRHLLLKLAMLIVILIFAGIMPIYDHITEARQIARIRVHQVYIRKTANPYDDDMPFTVLAISNGYAKCGFGTHGLTDSISLRDLARGYICVATSPAAPAIVKVWVTTNYIFNFTNQGGPLTNGK